MRIGVPRWIIVSLAGFFSAYIVFLGVYALSQPIGIPESPYPSLVAMGLYAVATVVSLLPSSQVRMPVWMAAFNVSVAAAVTLLVTSQLDPSKPTGYSTWHVAAVGVLMTITSTRQQHGWAWAGIAVLVLDTVFWAGPIGIVNLGLFGSISWVALSHVLSISLTRAVRDARRFSLAERETSDWQAAQEAHINERQFRLGRTGETAMEMLRQIRDSRGELTELQREECLYLEGAIRDEIRGRTLLNNDVRMEVMRARRRGATVTLLDEGGIDDLPLRELDRVLSAVAEAIRGTDADRVIVRTVPEGSEVAVTVVGIRNPDEHARMLGQDGDEDVALWLEVPRVIQPA